MTCNAILYNILHISCNKSQFPVFVEKRDWVGKICTLDVTLYSTAQNVYLYLMKPLCCITNSGLDTNTTLDKL